MHARKVFWWMIGFIAAVLLIGAIATPNLLRSRMAANEAARLGRMRTFAQYKQASPADTAGEQNAPERKIIRKVSLELVVANVNAASNDLRQVAATYRGFVDHAQIEEAAGRNTSGELQLRIPSDELEAALAEFKKHAVRVAHEEMAATDVSHEWADNDARMHNLKASEQQYLDIMRRAGSIKEVLEVTEKLNEVRGSIERLQAEMNIMQHDVAMSAVLITLVPQSADPGLLADWHPLLSARSAVGSMVGGVSAWCDFVIGLLIFMPAVLLWGGTIAAGAYLLYWILKLVSLKYGRSAATPKTVQ